MASFRQEILDNIVTTLGAITTGGGYNFSVGECMLGLKGLNDSPADIMPNIYIAGADEKRRNLAQRTYHSDIFVAVIGYVKQTDTADKPKLERDLSKLIADITKALMVDVTRGGYAVTTEIGDIDTDKGAFAPVAGFEMVVRCQYRASVSSP